MAMESRCERRGHGGCTAADGRLGLSSAATEGDHARPALLGRISQAERLGAPAPVAVNAAGDLADGGGVRPVVRGSSSGYQISHDLLRQMPRKVLVDGAQAGRGAAAGIESVEGRAVITLYSLLRDHPVDQ